MTHRDRLAARWWPHFNTEAEVEADRQARRERVWLMMLALPSWVLALLGRKWGRW